MLSRYIARVYFRYILLILSALVAFFVGMDMIGESEKLPESANLTLLYVLYQALYSLELILPLSLVFGAIAAKIHLIRMNELVASYALGASRLRILFPFVAVALLFSLSYIAITTTPLAYASDRARAIKQDRFFVSSIQQLFFKFDRNYVYIDELLPLQNEARGVEILEVDGGDLVRHISAQRAFFRRNAWQLEGVKQVSKPAVSGLQKEGIRIVRYPHYEALVGFRPEIMDSVYEGRSAFSLVDAARAWHLFSDQQISTDRIRGVFYSGLLFPLFAPIFVVIMFFFVPVSPRFFNVAFFSSMAVLVSLGGWGSLYALSQLARNGTLSAELALVLPFVVSLLIAGYLVRKERLPRAFSAPIG